MTRVLLSVVLAASAVAAGAAPVPGGGKKPQWLIVSARSGSANIYLYTEGEAEPKNLTDDKSNNSYPAWSPDGQTVAFCSDRDGAMHIFTMTADGGKVTQLTRGELMCRVPTWSADGKTLAFCRRTEAGSSEVFTVPAAGGDPKAIDLGGDAWDPAFSPDGKKLAFVSFRDGTGFKVYVADADGKNVTKLTDDANPTGFGYPAWSPDGMTIAFGHGGEGGLNIHTVGADGKGAKQLTKAGGVTVYPTYSPDGKKLAYYSQTTGDKGAFYVADADGSNATAVAKDEPPVEGGRPAWRPKLGRGEPKNGGDHAMTRSLAAVAGVAVVAAVLAAPVPAVKKNQWAFASDGHIYLFTEGDKEPKKLTSGENVNSKPAWSPDGKRIAFCSNRTGNVHICTMDADGKNEKQITQGDANRRGEIYCHVPSWHPDGKSIVFSRSFWEQSGDNDSEICVVNASDGSDLRVLSDKDDDYPSVSPDGKSIAFLSTRGGDGYGLHKMDSDGESVTKLAEEFTPGSYARPSWSPDGNAIAFGANGQEGVEIHVIRADGTGLKALTKFGRCAAWPSWSPDGKQIAFVLCEWPPSTDDKHALWVMDADGKNQREILKMSNPHLAFPAWRPK